MPLRALLDGRDLVAPSLSGSDWDDLRREVRSGAHALTLPCCGRPAFQRTSHRGLRHFYHAPDARCDEQGETLDHLHAKLAIMRGCEAAGYEARPEWTDGGWRADVLAVRGRVRIAFEVQWSRQTLAETAARQERYGAAGVRGCWFFRIPPLGLQRTGNDRSVEARRDLPLFELQQDECHASRVYLNGRHRELDAFVTALLTGKVRFCSRVWIPRWQQVTLRFFGVGCRRCGRASHVYCLERRSYASPCGVEVPLHSDWRDTASPALRNEVQRAAWVFLRSDEGLRLRVGTIKPRPVWARERISFGCFHCDAAFDGGALRRIEDEVEKTGDWAAVHHTTVAMARSFTRKRHHWCYPDDEAYCAG